MSKSSQCVNIFFVSIPIPWCFNRGLIKDVPDCNNCAFKGILNFYVRLGKYLVYKWSLKHKKSWTFYKHENLNFNKVAKEITHLYHKIIVFNTKVTLPLFEPGKFPKSMTFKSNSSLVS